MDRYWMIGSATGQLLGRLPSGHWGLYDVPYRVYQLWASLDDNVCVCVCLCVSFISAFL
jgi:hypothetical protein